MVTDVLTHEDADDVERAWLETIVEAAMLKLPRRRALFHSEADFQLALAWEIQTAHPGAEIRLEKRVLNQPRVELDVLIALGDIRRGLELKYPRSKLEAEIDGELFVLSSGAPDLDRYDVIKDLARLERLVDEGLIDRGCAVVLTNVPRLWLPASDRRETVYDAFRLHKGRTITGALDWSAVTGEGTKIGRVEALALRGSYALSWRDYSVVGERSFRYLMVPVS